MPLKGRNDAVETYIKKVREEVHQELHQQHSQPKPKSNPTQNEKQALCNLQQRNDIIIKPADKGSAVVILYRTDYIAEAERQLNNTMHYEKLDRDSLANITKEVKDAVQSIYVLKRNHQQKDQGLSHKPPRQANCLLIQHPNWGSPSLWTTTLKPLVSTLPSYVCDTTDFLKKIREIPTLPPDCLLVTLDLTSLYTNIPHMEGITACEETLDQRTTLDPPQQTFAA